MKVPSYNAEQYLLAFLSLLPRGRAWPKDPDSNLTKTISALMPTYELSGARAGALLHDIFPTTTGELLPEWEATVGLPDQCQGLNPTIEARRNQMVARFVNTGGQSIAHLTKFAADLGYPIGITEYAPTRTGLFSAGDALMEEGVQFTFKIDAPLTNQRFFIAGESAAGDALSSWGNKVLECEMATIKPAHTSAFHTYDGVRLGIAAGDVDDFTFAQNFVEDLAIGLNVELDNITMVTPEWCAAVKAMGVTHIRNFIYASPDRGFKTLDQLGHHFGGIETAIASGLKVLWHLTDLQDHIELAKPGMTEFLTMVCDEIKARNMSPEMLAVGFCNEMVGGTNADFNALNQQFLAHMRSRLPDHLILVSGAYWSDPFTLTDGTLVVSPDKRVLYDWHYYNWDFANASSWQWAGDTVRTWAATHGVVTINGEFNLYAEPPDSSTFADFPATIEAFAQGCGDQRGTIWAVTNGNLHRLNVSSSNSTLRPEIVTAIENATAHIRAQTYFKP